MKLKDEEISAIARKWHGTNVTTDVAKLIGHISYLESELDMARTSIGATLKARTSVEHSIARGLAKEILAKDNLLEFYKVKGKHLPMLVAAAAAQSENRRL